MKHYTDEELKDHIFELKQIIAKLLFQPAAHTEGFQRTSEERKQEILNEYISEQIEFQNY